MKPFGSGVPLVVDTSAWLRQSDPTYASRWRATVQAGLIVSCPVAALEMLTTSRDQIAFERLDRVLSALPQAPVTSTVCSAALNASRDLGARRRIPGPDYLIAAAAAERGFGVLHLDAHYDTLATVLGFESVRIDRD